MSSVFFRSLVGVARFKSEENRAMIPALLLEDGREDRRQGLMGGRQAVDSLEFHWRTLVPLELELYLSSTGVPLENLRSAGAPGDAPGHCQAVPQPGACPGHRTHG